MKRESYRQTLVWTSKIKILFLAVLFVTFAISVGIFYVVFSSSLGDLLKVLLFLVSIAVIYSLIPALLALISFLFSFPQYLLTSYIVWKAKRKLKSMEDLTVIGVTGSYGKTSFKHILYHILSSQKSVLMTPSSFNTPLGIARTILNDLKSTHEVFIVEMGAYHLGNIHELCKLVAPTYGIITGITEQHLERFGSLKEIVKTKSELIDRVMQHNGKTYINATDKQTAEAFSLYNENIITKSSEIYVTPPKVEHLPACKGISVERNKNKVICPLLGKYVGIYLQIAYSIYVDLGGNKSEFTSSVATIPYIPHRMELVKNNRNVIIIDDSFNGNARSFEAVADFIKNQRIGGKKILLTPGLMELGDDTVHIHYSLGKTLASVYTHYILIQSEGTASFMKALLESNISKENIGIVKTPEEAHELVATMLSPGDCVVFQNDASDNYL